MRAEGKVGFLVALPVCDLFPGLPKVSYTTTEAELDNMLRALVLLVHALFREAFRETEEPGMAIMSVHHKATIATEVGFTWFSRACSCDREAVALIDKDAAFDLRSRALSHPSGPPPGKPKRSLLYAYFGGGVARQPEEITGLVVRTRHIGLTAAVITAAKPLSWRWLGKRIRTSTRTV